MVSSLLNVQSLDALQRIRTRVRPLPASFSFTAVPVDNRWLMQLTGIGRLEKEPIYRADPTYRMPSEDLLVGMYGNGLPVAFVLRGRSGGVSLQVGTWKNQISGGFPQEQPVSGANPEVKILESILNGLYPVVNLKEVPPLLDTAWGKAGIGLGVPTLRPPDPSDGALPIDRLIRAMNGLEWGVLVLAEPVEVSRLSQIRIVLLDQLRAVQADAQSLNVPSPLAKQYEELVQLGLSNYTQAMAAGAWRTAIYLLGDVNGSSSYDQLTSVWQSIFGGPDSVLDPVRCYSHPEVAKWAAKWAMPDFAGEYSHHPFEYQTLLTSQQLASYLHTPNLETNGFTIRSVPVFDVPSPLKTDDSFILGKVVIREKPTQVPYLFPLMALTKHAFVCGVTGGGKTNTIMHLLQQASLANIPFLVIEPAKTEYRALLNDEVLGKSLRVYTLGKEMVSPFRLNPFEVPAGIPVGVHLDLLRSAFATGFGMWTPLPQILERCLYRIYQDAGWDLTTGENKRLTNEESSPLAFPTLTDLVNTVHSVTQSLGYEEKVTADLEAALLTRLDSLRTGGKGAMLDGQHPFSLEEVLKQPTVLELEGLGDDDDKALLISLLLIRLVEHRRVAGMQEGLQHLLIIEEAHRLLANPGGGRRQEEADPKGKAVETFANLLAEIRAYGQGVIIADQVPVKLAPEVIKNTNLKVVHRLVAEDDRRAVAGAMAMNERQAQALTSLTAGESVVFREGDEGSVMVKITSVKKPSSELPSDARVKAHMDQLLDRLAGHALAGQAGFLANRNGLHIHSGSIAPILKAEPFIRLFSRFVLSSVESHPLAIQGYPDLVSMIRSLRSADEQEDQLIKAVLLKAAEDLAQQRGRQNSWSYADTKLFGEALQNMLFHLSEDYLSEVASSAVTAFQQLALDLHFRHYEPYEYCARICDHAPVCLYRFWVKEVIDRGNFTSPWNEGEPWEIAKQAAYNVVEEENEYVTLESQYSISPVQQRAALCFAQQQVAFDISYLPRDRRIIMEQLIQKSQEVQNER